MLVPAAQFSDFILAVHILGVVVAFGIVFAFPVMMSFAARTDPALMPWLLRARQRVGRYVVNPGLTVVLLAGIYLATDEHRWSQFFVGWGILAVIVIGGLEGSLIIPRAARAADAAERDLAASAVPAGGTRTSAQWAPDTQNLFRRLSVAGWAIQAIVVVTVFLMTTHAGA